LTETIHKTNFSALAGPFTTPGFLDSSGLPPINDTQWAALTSFWQMPWFIRAWIYQEFFAAKNVRMIFGSYETDWRTLSDGAEKINRYGLLSLSPYTPDKAFLTLLSGLANFTEMAQRKTDELFHDKIDFAFYWSRFYSERDKTSQKEIDWIRGEDTRYLKGIFDIFKLMRNPDTFTIDFLKSIAEQACPPIMTVPTTINRSLLLTACLSCTSQTLETKSTLLLQCHRKLIFPSSILAILILLQLYIPALHGITCAKATPLQLLA
jgi:hypothetical protein